MNPVSGAFDEEYGFAGNKPRSSWSPQTPAVDAADRPKATGYEDVLSKIAMCRSHYADVGLGAGYVDQFVR